MPYKDSEKQKLNKKEYCVHVYEQAHQYENIQATSPQQAELLAVRRHNGGDYNTIDHIEVMRTCKCGLDNDIANEKCDDCGKKL